jgi:hypothetical protein
MGRAYLGSSDGVLDFKCAIGSHLRSPLSNSLWDLMENTVVSLQPNVKQLSFVPRRRPPGVFTHRAFRGINQPKTLKDLPAMLKDLPDDQFFSLIFTSDDRLGMDYVEEARRRKENMVPFLSVVLSEEKNYQLEGEGFWTVVQAVHLLGILGDPRGFHGLLLAKRNSESALRRFFAKKGKTGLFSEIKEQSLGLIKAPQSDLETKGFDHYFAPIIPKIGFESKEELEEFMNTFLEYHNSLAAQFPPHYPGDRESFH